MSTVVNSTTATHSRTTTDPTGIQSQSSREGRGREGEETAGAKRREGVGTSLTATSIPRA